MSAAIQKRRQLKVLDFFTNIVSRVGHWFGEEVYSCPENDLDSLLWPILLVHAKLTMIHAQLTRDWFNQGSIRGERLRYLWRYYWNFQSHEHRQKAKGVIVEVTREYQKDLQ